MIMFFLPWWIYVLIGTVVFTSAFGGIWLAGIAFDRETEDETYPCLAHLGTDTDGAEDWCGQKHGHSGDHLGMRQYFDADETVFTREWPEEEGPLLRDGEDLEYQSPGIYKIVPAPRPSLPQRLSKVPEQDSAIQGSGYTPAQLLGQPDHNDPWPVCGHSNMNGMCDLAKGHPGDHSHMCY